MYISRNTKKNAKGSVLIFSLIILSFLLIASLSTAALTISETRSSIAIDRSSVAFQTADAGMEILLDKVYGGTCNGQRLDCLGTCQITNGAAGIEGNINNGSYRVIFFELSGDEIDSCANTTWRDDAASLQSSGEYLGTKRSVKTDIKPL